MARYATLNLLVAISLTTLTVGCEKAEPIPQAAPEAKSDLAVMPETMPQPASQPTLEIDEFTSCAAATLKSGDLELWRKWSSALLQRYRTIYPDKSSADAESYMLERVTDKRRRLNSMGIDSQKAFVDYYKKNCEGAL